MKTEPRAVLAAEVAMMGGGMKCQGCKGTVSRLDYQTSLRLRGGEEWLLPPAYECPRCQVIIFEAELQEGRFVPPQFRLVSLGCQANSGNFIRK